MSTRSNIGIIKENDTIDMIYCHWDGYPSNNGKILLANYSNTDAVRELIALGDLSNLGEVIGEKHDFNYGMTFKPGTPEYNALARQCNVYSRDRVETGTKARKSLSLRKAMELMEEYLYLWDTKNSKWFYSDHGSELIPLTQKSCKE